MMDRKYSQVTRHWNRGSRGQSGCSRGRGSAARVRTTLGLLLLAAVPLACDGDPTGIDVEPITGLPRSLSVAEQQVIEASNGFAFGLLREVRAAEWTHNTFLSPLSASMALGMAMNGAAGESRTQMRDALGFVGMEEQAINEGYRDLIALLLDLDPSVDFALGNGLWSDNSRVALLPDFVDRVRTYFDAEVSTLDFSDPASKDVMNDWVADVTNGRIENLIDHISADIVAYLINAVYFLADWRSTFDADRTRDGVFTRADGSRVTAAFMDDNVGYRVLNLGDPGAPRGVELPYGGGAFTAVAMLPPEGQRIDDFVAGIDDGTWGAWMDHFDAAAETEDLDHKGVRVLLPRFELDWKSGLIPALDALGMKDVFAARVADLSRMNGGQDLFIGRVIHQTFVKVDEKGTEAAAATAVGVETTSVAPTLTYDRPFLFAIRERYSGAVLFVGVIGDPSE